MDNNKDPLSLATVVVWVFAGVLVPSEILAFDVTFHLPVCAEINLPTVVVPPCDGGSFFLRTGRSFYGPFVQDGSPIEILAEAITSDYEGMRLPLYFELIPGNCNVCNFECRSAGLLVWETLGSYDCIWTTSGSIVIPPPLFPAGSIYWIRVTGFGRRTPPGQLDQVSPPLRDVRVRSLPRTSMLQTSWDFAKRLFR